METFSWCPVIDATAAVTNRTLSAQFGDGYEQAAGDGINRKSAVWPLRFVGTRAEMKALTDFLDAHGQWKRFLWTDPLGNEGVYRSGEYSPTPHGGNSVSITVQFKQTAAV